jgi:Tol biopolymer transport system component
VFSVGPRRSRVDLVVMAGLSLSLACGDTSGTARLSAPTLVATVRQFGPVGYRDPLGVISPDGRQLAVATHHRLRIESLSGGAGRTLPSGLTRVQHLAWRPDGRLVVSQPDSGITWWWYDAEGNRRALWPAGTTLRASSGAAVDATALRELTWSADGTRAAAMQTTAGGSVLWILDSLGQPIETHSSPARLGYPVWVSDGRLGCLAFQDNRQRVTLPCGEGSPKGLDSLEAYGPLAAAPDGRELFLAVPNDSGFLSLWTWDLTRGSGRLIAGFARDTYAPSVARDGRILFKEQEYHTEVLVQPVDGGPAVLRTAFQAETPSWDPSGTRLGITYGTWRRVIDDFRYPDIAQDAGIVAADGQTAATKPDQVVQSSPSEDQGLSWSPNRRWIAFHSHQQGSDDIWLRPVDAATAAIRISWLGRGAEVGWPRWSPNGKWILFNGDSVRAGRRQSLLWIIGIDQVSGAVTQPARAIPLPGFADDAGHAEWLPSSEELVFAGTGLPEAHALYRVRRTGGIPRVLHRYQSPQIVDGFGLSPDGSWLVFPQPDSNGRLQLFRLPTIAGAEPKQLTSDSTDKTQPSVSPDGRRIAFTVWRYQARFWTLSPSKTEP